MMIQAIIVEEERNRPESALISNLRQLWTFDRNPFGISGIEHATFCGTKPELRPDQPVSPRITARQEIVSSKKGGAFQRSHDARAVSPGFSRSDACFARRLC